MQGRERHTRHAAVVSGRKNCKHKVYMQTQLGCGAAPAGTHTGPFNPPHPHAQAQLSHRDPGNSGSNDWLLQACSSPSPTERDWGFLSVSGCSAEEAGVSVQFLGRAGSHCPAWVFAGGSVQRLSLWRVLLLQIAAWLPSINQRKSPSHT